MKLGDLLPAQLGGLDGLLEQEAWDRHGLTPTHGGTNFSTKELLLSLKGQASFRTLSVKSWHSLSEILQRHSYSIGAVRPNLSQSGHSVVTGP